MNRWNPVREMITMREAIVRMQDENLRLRPVPTSTTWVLPLDAYFTDDAIVIQVDVAGLKPEDLSITLEGDTLTLRGEIKSRAEDNKYLLRERPAGKFERILTINTPIDNAKADAHFENGVLTLTLPKAESAKPRQITIKPSAN